MSQVSREITEFKADDPEGLFAAKVSVFGNKDRNGDRVMKGAFDRTIEIWRSSGKKIEVVVAGKLDVKGNPLAMRAFNLLHDGLVGEWSFAYKVNQEELGKDGVRQIWDLDLFEVGPTLIGANPETLTLATKEAGLLVRDDATANAANVGVEVPLGGWGVIESDGTTTSVSVSTTPFEDKQVDRSEWDGAAAMASADSAADYRAICAGERSTGEPDERQHWALPHHKSPGAAPNANGVRNALARLPQTEGLKNAEAARRHLEAHMASVRSEAAEAEAVESKLGQAVDEAVADLDRELDTLIEEKIGRVISRRTAEKIRAAVSQLNEVLSSALEEEAPTPAASAPSEEKAAEEPAPLSETALARRSVEKLGLFLTERDR
jgi:hypothetical protein